MEILAAL